MQWRIHAVLPHLRGRVLDIGCGTNDLLRRYRQRQPTAEAAESVGVDVFDWPGADLLVDDSSTLPYADASFETVAFVASLNHIPNRVDVLRECRRLIRGGGQVVVTMLPPRLSWAWHQVRRPWDADQIERGMQPGEVYGLTRRQIDDLLRKAGFEPVGHCRFMLGMNLLTLARPAVSAVNGSKVRLGRRQAREAGDESADEAEALLPQPVAARVTDRVTEAPVAPVSPVGAAER